jgi:hypothetical protein
VRKLTTPRNLLVEKLVHIPRGKERRGNIPRAMTLKNLRKPNHPHFDGEIKKGEEVEVWLLGLKKYFKSP